MYPLRASCHLLQLVQKSALPEVSVGGSRSLAGKASSGTSSNPLRARGLHASSSFGPVGSAKPECHLQSFVSHQCGNTSGSRADPRHLGAEIGFFSVLHTWTQKLELHPHVHCVVPAGGLSADHTRWIKPLYDFFLPVEVLSHVFRGKFHEALKRAFHDGKLAFHGDLKLLAQPKTFAAWLRPLFRKDWVVYAKRPFGG